MKTHQLLIICFTLIKAIAVNTIADTEREERLIEQLISAKP
jgi:hypothetical protein